MAINTYITIEVDIINSLKPSNTPVLSWVTLLEILPDISCVKYAMEWRLT